MIAHILGVKRVRLAIEDNKPDAVLAMRTAATSDKASGDDAVVILDTRYPQGSEKQLIYAVTGREVPSGGLPMDVGVLVENVATVRAVWDAVRNGRPLTARIVTVSGDAVTEPANVGAPVGALFSDLAACCGGLRPGARRIVAGGPMMGFAQGSLEVPVTKTTSGILALSVDRLQAFTSMACIGCGRCLSACPMRLTPSELSQNIESDAMDEAEALNVMDCFECGCCAYVCPSHRPLVQHMRRAKTAVVLRRRKEQAR